MSCNSSSSSRSCNSSISSRSCNGSSSRGGVVIVVVGEEEL